MFQYSEKVGIVCRVDFESEVNGDAVVTVKTAKGIETLQHYSELRGDLELRNYLLETHNVVNVHVNCRHTYTKKNYELTKRHAESTSDVVERNFFRSDVRFDLKQDCFLCGKSIASGVKGETIKAVETVEFRDKMLHSTMRGEALGWRQTS